MAGSIVRRVSPRTGKVSWQAKLRVGTGWRSETFERQRDAKAALQVWQGEGRVAPSPETIGAYLTHWLHTVKRHSLKKSTYRSYTWQVRTQILPTLGHVALQALTTTQAQAWISKEKDRISDKTGQPISARMVRYSYTLLHAAFAQAQSAGLVRANVWDAVTPPRPAPKRGVVWNEAQVARFLAAACRTFYHPIWLVSLTTGMRIGELLGLRWSDVDIEGATATVEQGVVLWDEGFDFDTPKTESGRRTVSLGAITVAALREHRVRQDAQREKRGAAWTNLDLVFASRNGTPLEPTNVRRELRLITERLGLPHTRLHGLRHASSTIAIQNGVPINTVSQRLGHSRVETTLALYVRSRQEDERGVSETMEGLMGVVDGSNAGT